MQVETEQSNSGERRLEQGAGNRRRTRRGRVLLLGLAVAATGLAIVAPGLVQAGDDAGVMDVIRRDAGRREVVRPPVAVAYAPPAPVPALPRVIWSGPPAGPAPAPLRLERPSEGRSVARPSIRRPVRAEKAADRSVRSAASSGSSVPSFGGRSICVRLCDGYHFPLAPGSVAGDAEATEALCNAGCPDAQMKLFSVRPGAEDIDDAVSRDRQVYRKLATAFAYRQGFDPSCTCRKADGGARVPLLKDPTLRPGDVVVLEKGARVFTGGSVPHGPGDFAEFRSAGTLSKAARQAVDDIVGASFAEVAARSFKADLRQRQARVGALTPPEVSTDAAPTVAAVRVIPTAPVPAH